MDKNKLKVLREINYVIPKQCGLCRHGQFADADAPWGTCALRTYVHEKHTGAPRQLSVFRHGGCPDKFELSPEGEQALGTWAEFVDRREYTRSNRHKAPTRY